MKKIGKTTRPFRYDLNQILHDFTVEVTRLDLVDRVPELWMEVPNTAEEAVIKTIPKKKAERLCEEALQIAEERRKVKGKEEREKIYLTEGRVPENRKER